MGSEVEAAYYDKINPSLEYMNNVISTSDEPIEVAKVILKALIAKNEISLSGKVCVLEITCMAIAG